MHPHLSSLLPDNREKKEYQNASNAKKKGREEVKVNPETEAMNSWVMRTVKLVLKYSKVME